MKKLYRKSTVHPSAPPVSDNLAFLPAAIFTLTIALSPADREVLAYLLSCSSTNFSGNRKSSHKTTAGDHQPSFTCNCFRCYTSYWIRWDSSPNRQLIHEIIDAFENIDVLAKEKNKKIRRSNSNSNSKKAVAVRVYGNSISSNNSNNNGNVNDMLDELDELTRCVEVSKDEFVELESVKEKNKIGRAEDADDEDDENQKSGVRKFVSSIGERIWSVWAL